MFSCHRVLVAGLFLFPLAVSASTAPGPGRIPAGVQRAPKPGPVAPEPRPEIVVTEVKGPAKPPAPGVDLHCDPLPTGAVARAGTSRLRHEGPVTGVTFLSGGKVVSAGLDGT